MIGTILIITLLSPNIRVLADASSGSTINIGISPSDYLFDIKNMKPGDWAPRDIAVKNTGVDEFKYSTTAKFTGGSKKLFHELLLEINDADDELYKGKLADFDKLSPRNIKPSNEEELTFTIRFPKQLGNDFQGLRTQFDLTFFAEGEDNEMDEAISGGIIGGDNNFPAGGSLPNTATDMLTYLVVGGALVVVGIIFYMLQKIRRIRENEV